jgi:hypothetical protein
MCNSIKSKNHSNIKSIPKYGIAWKVFLTFDEISEIRPRWKCGVTHYYSSVCGWVNWYHPLWVAYEGKNKESSVGFCLFKHFDDANKHCHNPNGIFRVQYDGRISSHYESLINAEIIIAKSFRLLPRYDGEDMSKYTLPIITNFIKWRGISDYLKNKYKI